jgi:TRAP-type C4-dicarboxylate transport system permease small subunit
VTNAEINRLSGREEVGGGIVILSYFCGIVGWYIWYKWDKSLQEVTQDKNVPYSSNFILWLILSVLAGVGGLVMMFQVQDTINSMNESRA